MKTRRFTHPMDHLVASQVFNPDQYDELCEAWPETITGHGRVGHDLMPGDVLYDRLRRDSVWSETLEYLHSPEFISILMAEFQDSEMWNKAAFQPNNYELIDLVEPRPYVPQHNWPPQHVRPVDKLFVRADFQEGPVGYENKLHVDHLRRVIGGVIQFSNADDLDMKGGELVIHGDGSSPKKSFKFRGNQAIFWLSHRQSFHEGTKVTQVRGARRWIYFALSATQDVWGK